VAAFDERYPLEVPGYCDIIALNFLLSAHLAKGARPADEGTRIVRSEMEKQHIPGLALLVSGKGVPIRVAVRDMRKPKRGPWPTKSRRSSFQCESNWANKGIPN
jgi:hypothetical protein